MPGVKSNPNCTLWQQPNNLTNQYNLVEKIFKFFLEFAAIQRTITRIIAVGAFVWNLDNLVALFPAAILDDIIGIITSGSWKTWTCIPAFAYPRKKVVGRKGVPEFTWLLKKA